MTATTDVLGKVTDVQTTLSYGSSKMAAARATAQSDSAGRLRHPGLAAATRLRPRPMGDVLFRDRHRHRLRSQWAGPLAAAQTDP